MGRNRAESLQVTPGKAYVFHIFRGLVEGLEQIDGKYIRGTGEVGKASFGGKCPASFMKFTPTSGGPDPIVRTLVRAM